MASEPTSRTRLATREDVPSILWLTELFAESRKWNPDKNPLVSKIGEKELLRDVDGFGDTPCFHVLLAELNASAPVGRTASPSRSMSHDERIVGQVFYYFSYLTREGRVLFLEDLFVREGRWSDGVGLSLMQECARIAERNECCRVQLLVSDRNKPAIALYERIGAAFLTKWLSVRLTRPTLGEFASSGTLTANESASSRAPSWTIRPATERDIPSILWLVQLLAEHVKEPHALAIREKELLRDGFGSTRPYFHVLLAELPTAVLAPVKENQASPAPACKSSSMSHGERVVGQAFFYYGYSVWGGRVLYLEDLFVRKEYRNYGIGQSLIRECAKLAEASDCCRLQTHVLDWNEPAIAFYKRIKATLSREWKTVRIATKNWRVGS